jgi:hypothetical protein
MGASTQALWLTGCGAGTHLRAYEELGAHPREADGRGGQGNVGDAAAAPLPDHGWPYSLSPTRALGIGIVRPEAR